MFLDRYIDYLTFERRFSPHTIAGYRLEVQKLDQYLSQIGESSRTVQFSHLRSYFADLLEGGGHPNSINRSISALRTYFNFLQREQLVSKNPTHGIRALRKPKRLPTVVDYKQLSQLLDQDDLFSTDFKGIRDRLILEFLFCTGVRVAELIQLQQSSLDLFNKQVRILGKRNKERILPLTESLVTRILQYKQQIQLEGYDHPALILTDSGKKSYPKMIYRVVHKYLTMISTQQKRSPHVLRHTFATAMLDQGADLNAIKELLGHTGLSATQIYTHNSVERLKSIYNQAHPRA